MKLRFETTLSGPSATFPLGLVIDVDHLTPEMQRWIEGGIVSVVRDPDAALETPEDGGNQESADRPFVQTQYPGATVVCVGGGPSLTAEDVTAVRGRAVVIAINDAYRLAPWADVLYAADAAWWRHHWAAVKDLPAKKWSIHSADRVLPRGHTITVLANTGTTGLERSPSGLRNGKNSGYQAINLAVHLGARRIVLLGYDMGHADKQPEHWFGKHPDTLNSHSPYAEFLEAFPTLITPLTRLKVEVVNCSRQTRLTCFPRATLAETLAGTQVAA